MKISFVIPSYNCVTWLPHAVTTVLQQTHKDVECVIVDDCSTDRTKEYTDWVERHDQRVKVIRNEVNMGRSASRNLGNMAATGEVICVLDADDLATPNRAELMVKKFSKSQADFVYGSATVINCLGGPLYVIGADVFDQERALATLKNRIVHSTVAYRKEFAEKFPYRGGEIARLGIDDWAQQIEAKLAGASFDFVPHRLACYRELSTGISKTRNEAAVEKAKRDFLASLKVPA